MFRNLFKNFSLEDVHVRGLIDIVKGHSFLIQEVTQSKKEDRGDGIGGSVDMSLGVVQEAKWAAVSDKKIKAGPPC